MVIFQKVSNHIEVAVADLVEPVEHQANLFPTIVAETIHSLIFFLKEKAKDSSSGAFNFCTFGLEVISSAHI